MKKVKKARTAGKRRKWKRRNPTSGYSTHDAFFALLLLTLLIGIFFIAAANNVGNGTDSPSISSANIVGNFITGAVVGPGDGSDGSEQKVLASLTECGFITEDSILTQNVEAAGTCFQFGDNDLSIDCQGYSVVFDTGGFGAYGFDITDVSAAQIRNCNINQSGAGETGAAGIFVDTTGVSSLNHTFENNNITMGKEAGHGIYIKGNEGRDVSNTTINNNTINVTGNSAYAIYVLGGGANYTKIKSNIIESGNSAALVIENSSNHIIENNQIRGTVGINISPSPDGNKPKNITFLNNNLSVSRLSSYLIYDHSGSLSENYLVYNNSYGQIKFTNVSFLQNLTMNITGGEFTMAVDGDIYINDSIIAFNSSAFDVGIGGINSTANLSLKDLDFDSINETRIVHNFTTSANDTIDAGVDCNETLYACGIVSYANNELLFNVTGFSSIAAFGPDGAGGDSDSLAPNVTWVTPLNGTNYSISFGNQTFNVSIFEGGTVYNVSFSFDNSTGIAFNSTAANGSGHWAASVNVSGLIEGTHLVTVHANDTSQNTNNTEQFTIFTDFTPPTATWNSPTNGSNYSITFFNQTFNVSVGELNTIVNLSFSFSNATGKAFNLSGHNQSGYWSRSLNVSGLVEGSHLVTVHVNDTAGNVNNTQFLNFTVDFTSPTVTWNSPLNKSNYSINHFNQTFNVSIDELNYVNNLSFSFSNATGKAFNLTGHNQSGYWSASFNVSGLVEGSHLVTLHVNDTAGNVNNTQYLNFTVDFTPPTVTWNSPLNKSNYSISFFNQTFNVSISELNSIVNLSFSFSNATGKAFNLTGHNQSGYWSASLNVSGLTEGSHLVTLHANDTAGNVNNTQYLNFTVDFTPPTVTWNSPLNKSNYSISFFNQTFNVSISELNSIVNLSFSFSNASGKAFNLSGHNQSGYWSRSLNVSGLVEGSHLVTVHVNDTAGNVNNTQYLNFTVDFTAPNVTWNTPGNGSNYSRTSFNQTFNVSISELNSIVNLSFSFSNASGKAFNLTGHNQSGYWSASLNVSGLVEGSHLVTLHVNDTAGNVNNTQFLNFTVDFTAPTVTWNTPKNMSNFSRTSFNQTFNASIKELNYISNLSFSISNATGRAFNITGHNQTGYWSASFNVSGLVEGYHFVTVHTNDTVNNVNNTQQLSFTVDFTVPNVTWNSPSQLNYSARNTTTVFNISLGDLSVQTVLFSFDNSTGNGFNLTASNHSGYWNVSYNVSALTEGNNTVTVIANDSLGNYNRTERVVLVVDKTGPTISVSCSPNTVTAGSTVSCTCTASDSGTTVKEDPLFLGDTDNEESTTASGVGSKTSSTCSATDYVGNVGSGTGGYTVSAAASSGSSSGGGGGGGRARRPPPEAVDDEPPAEQPDREVPAEPPSGTSQEGEIEESLLQKAMPQTVTGRLMRSVGQALFQPVREIAGDFGLYWIGLIVTVALLGLGMVVIRNIRRISTPDTMGGLSAAEVKQRKQALLRDINQVALRMKSLEHVSPAERARRSAELAQKLSEFGSQLVELKKQASVGVGAAGLSTKPLDPEEQKLQESLGKIKEELSDMQQQIQKNISTPISQWDEEEKESLLKSLLYVRYKILALQEQSAHLDMLRSKKSRASFVLPDRKSRTESGLHDKISWVDKQLSQLELASPKKVHIASSPVPTSPISSKMGKVEVLERLKDVKAAVARGSASSSAGHLAGNTRNVPVSVGSGTTAKEDKLRKKMRAVEEQITQLESASLQRVRVASSTSPTTPSSRVGSIEMLEGIKDVKEAIARGAGRDALDSRDTNGTTKGKRLQRQMQAVDDKISQLDSKSESTEVSKARVASSAPLTGHTAERKELLNRLKNLKQAIARPLRRTDSQNLNQSSPDKSSVKSRLEKEISDLDRELQQLEKAPDQAVKVSQQQGYRGTAQVFSRMKSVSLPQPVQQLQQTVRKPTIRDRRLQRKLNKVNVALSRTLNDKRAEPLDSINDSSVEPGKMSGELSQLDQQVMGLIKLLSKKID